MKSYLTSQILDDAQYIQEIGAFMYVCTIDKDLLPREKAYTTVEMKNLNVWKIKRIETITSDTGDTTIITYPEGDKRFRFSVERMQMYTYKF